MRYRIYLFICVCFFSANVPASDNKITHSLVLSLPELDWAITMEAGDFNIKEYEIAPQGDAARFLAVNRQNGMIMSGFLEKAPKKGGAEDCRAYYWARAQKSPVPKSNIKMSQSGEMKIVEYMVKEYMGEEVNQKNLNAYLAESGYWIDIHLSKVGYEASDKQLFDDILRKVQKIQGYKPDSFMLFNYGNLYYQQKNYPSAIPYYEKAVALETGERTLPRVFWIIMVDQLGMSHGISGNTERAIETYNAALLKEPEYPLFYYNLACAYAESNDLGGAIENLKTAYKYRKNLLPGEKIPNPRTDPSFQRFLNDDAFLTELEYME
jgi:tetratricopeptide (TPR) repeat protein